MKLISNVDRGRSRGIFFAVGIGCVLAVVQPGKPEKGTFIAIILNARSLRSNVDGISAAAVGGLNVHDGGFLKNP